ncbi:MAG: RNA-binding domain-containing protein [Nitrososphaerota archaeon]
MGSLSIRARAICGPTESEAKVRQAILNILSIEREMTFTAHRLSGIFGEPLTVLEVEVPEELAEETAQRILSKLPQEYLSERIERSGAVERIHLRLDKQLAYLGIIQPSEVDSIKLEITSRK